MTVLSTGICLVATRMLEQNRYIAFTFLGASKALIER